MRVFISYKTSSFQFANKLYDFLAEHGIDSWLDQRNIHPGQDWRGSIEAGLRECTHMILLITQEALTSEEVKAEWNYFLDNKKSILPVILETVHDLPSRLRIIQWMDISQNAVEDALPLITNVIRTTANKAAADEATTTSSFKLIEIFNADYFAKTTDTFTSKMLGVRYKEKYSSTYYLQRDNINQHFNDFLQSSKSVMVLTGKAGSGKSSFVCDLAYHAQDNIVWLQDCAHLQLPDDSNIATYIATTVRYPLSANGTSDFIKFITDLEHPTLFIFDAVNEYEYPESLLSAITEFVLSVKNSKAKFLLSCRMPNWGTIRRHLSIPSEMEYHTSGPNSYVAVEAFGDQESRAAYEQYCASFNIRTPYQELSPHIREFLTQPLFMKLLALSYSDKEIPESLGIEDVFYAYVAKCLGRDDQDHDSRLYQRKYAVLTRAIELMFERTRRELELALLVEDQTLRNRLDFGTEFSQAYNQLLSEGILTQRSEEANMFLKSFDVVFVTYERVFEYLLANVVINPPTIDKINQMLEIAQQRAFAQLRGAAELSLSFAVIKGTLDHDSIVKLAQLDRAESRQFLSDVLHTIYSSGHSAHVLKIIDKLIADSSNSAKILALQASYQMKLDTYLIRLCVSKTEFVRNMAILFLYQRWNKSRLEGRIEDGYEPLRQLSAKIRLTHPQSSIQYLSALTFLSLNMIGHAIDDGKSLIPLIQIWQNIARKVPGIQFDVATGLGGAIGRVVFSAIVEVVTQIFKYTFKDSVLGDLKLFWGAPENFRPFLDAINLRDETSLIPYKDDVLRYMSWDHQLVNYVMCVPLIQHVYNNLKETSELLQDLSFLANEKQSRVKYGIAHALIYGGLFRLMRNLPVPGDYLALLNDSFIDYWLSANEELEDGKKRYEVEGSVTKTMPDSVLVLLVGLLNVEGSLQRSAGKVTGSQFICDFVSNPLIQDLTPDHIILCIKAVERYAYQGSPEYSVYSMLKSEFRNLWESKCPQVGYKTLANIRAYFQQEVDSILRENLPQNRNLIDTVRMIEGLPNTKDVLFTNNTFWMLGGAIELNIGKILGILMMRLTTSTSVEEFARDTAKTMASMLFNYDTINIAMIEWFKAHDPSWNKLEENEIPQRLLEESPEVHQYWRSIADEFISKFGKGIVYDK